MNGATDPRLLLPRSLRELPVDLAAVAGVVLVTNLVVFAPLISETPLRVLFGLAFVLVCPGYALVAALFPEAGGAPGSFEETDPNDRTDAAETTSEAASTTVTAEDESEASGAATADQTGRTAGGIDGIERVALSIGLSVAVVPLVGLVLNFTPLGIRLVPIVLVLSALTLGTAALAARRRWALSPEERFTIPYREWTTNARSELFRPATRADAALNVLLVVSLLLATTSVGYALFVPSEGEGFTEFYLLTENDSGGLVATDYPRNFTQGEGKPLVVGIENNEGESVEYTAVVTLQRVERGSNNTTRVIEERELRRFGTQVAPNETWRRPHTLTPTMRGDRLRVAYLLYRGSVPEDPGAENAYRELHLWVNVSSAP
ncbi:hypothetical protein BRC86_07900 [Halobacteriales archaeon QS_3_64_16]|nr:MAG: hypothetical protein BRC86_07900 [Halobacteriales archaeon QS_3_64_16]